jgi:hypothetical protein
VTLSAVVPHLVRDVGPHNARTASNPEGLVEVHLEPDVYSSKGRTDSFQFMGAVNQQREIALRWGQATEMEARLG